MGPDREGEYVWAQPGGNLRLEPKWLLEPGKFILEWKVSLKWIVLS